MFLFHRIDFVALTGLWVQAFLAWVFVVILGALRRREPGSTALVSFHHAFLALAAGLSILSLRFFRAHDVEPELAWNDGQWPATASYVAYLGLKGAFGWFILHGCAQLAGRRIEPSFRRAAWIVLAALALAPLVQPNITPLLIVQAPAMVACAWFSLRLLPRADEADHGLRFVRGSLWCLLGAWCVHGVAAALVETVPAAAFVLSLNSLFDLAVQLMLGLGLVIGVLQQSHRRWRDAEKERERLERELAHDEKLRALGTLVSGVAHELNNPLTVVLGYAQILRETPAFSRQANIIVEQAERCRGIVRSLSALVGQSAKSLEEFDARELAERVVRGLELSASAQGKKMRVQADPGIVLCADRIGIEQVLANLVANALDASPPGASVFVAARDTQAGVELTVTDQGPGVPAGERERIFEPFFTTKKSGKGTGLGLAIVHAIVRAHGGSIEIVDGPGGRGATFRVLVPSRAAVRPSEDTVRVETAHGQKLLVIDDDAAVRAVLRQHAERRGWIVTEADGAESALRDREELERFDAVLCDLRMPGMGGIGFHDALEREASQVLARTVFATGDLASPDAVSFSRRCRQPLAAKPFEFEALFSALERAAQPAVAPR